MAASGKAPGSFVRVYSHAQSLGQCASWLAQNMPNAERVAVSSNAEASRIAAGEADACAIGPEAAGEYRLGLAADVQDDAKRST